MNWKNKPLECLALKASRAYFWETYRAGGNRDSTLKACIQNLTCSRTQGKEPGSDPPADLGESPGEARGNWGSSQGYKHWQQPFLGARSATGHWCCKCHFFYPSFSLLVPGLSPTHQAFDTNNGTPQAKQLPGVGHSTTYQQTGCLNTPRAQSHYWTRPFH